MNLLIHVWAVGRSAKLINEEGVDKCWINKKFPPSNEVSKYSLSDSHCQFYRIIPPLLFTFIQNDAILITPLVWTFLLEEVSTKTL